MKELKEYKRYIVPGLLIVLILIVWSITLKNLWPIIPKNFGNRYQVHISNNGALVYIFEPTTGHLWLRCYPLSKEKTYLIDLGTVKNPCWEEIRQKQGTGIFDDIRLLFKPIPKKY